MAVAVGQLVFPVGKGLHRKFREHARYTVKIPGTDDIYDELHEWVLGLLPPKEQRALVAWTSKRSDAGALSAIGEYREQAPPPRIRLHYDGAREQTVSVAGHKVKVVVSAADLGKDDGRFKPPEIVFTVYSLDAQRALLAEVNKVAHRSHEAKHQPVFRMMNSWGDWDRLDDLPNRGLDTVILPEGQLDRLIADVGRFLDSEDEYLRRCIPWHRGHLYEGPPGTGKTSVARAIASHFGMDIWYMPLADVKKDGSLLRMVARISPRSMLLLEDADVFHAATKRDDDADAATLSGLLNAIDGIGTPHGLFTVMTTNSIESLDSALIRPGRVDLIESFVHADDNQVKRLLSRWYGEPVTNPVQIQNVAPAEVIEVCKRNDTPRGAIHDLINLKHAASCR